MTEKAKELLDKFDHNLNDVLFDLVDENETLEGQVNELREQVAKLAEKQNHKTVDVKLGGELIYRQAVLEAIEDDTRLGMYSRFASNNDAQCFKQVVNEIPPAENKGEDRPKGRWIGHREHCENLGLMPSGLGAYEWCSNCDCGIDVREWHRNDYNYCPNCGAKMKGGEEK